MRLVSDFHTDSETNLGGKVTGLLQLQALGALVPEFVVLTEIEKEEKNAQEDLREIFLQINQKLQLKKNQKVILRSSANLEDGKKHSFAGLFESVEIFWTENNFTSALEKMRQSLDNPRLKTYLKSLEKPEQEGNLDNGRKIENSVKESIQLNILVQKFVDFDYSGVGFSSNPQHPERGILLSLARGKAKQVVDGEAGQELEISYFGQVTKGNRLLKRREIGQIVAVLNRLRQTLGNVDIEFGFKSGQLWLLQARKITSFGKSKTFLLDSSNLRENFPETVLPLTYSLLQEIYAQTYFDLIEQNGQDSSFLSHHQDLFNNLLVNWRGQIFYNIGNWYSFAKLLPNSKNNNQALQKLITGKVEDYLPQTRPLSPFFTLKYYLIFLWKYLNFERTITNYQKKAKKYLQSLQFTDFSQFSTPSLYKIWVELRANMDRETYTNAENDFLLMFFLQKLDQKIGENKLNQALCFLAAQNPISSRQISQLKIIKQNLEQKVEHKELLASALDYLETYRGRFPQELNLAKKDISVQSVAQVLDLALSQDHKNENEKKQINKSSQGPLLQKPLEKPPENNLQKPKLSWLENFYLSRIQFFLENREKNRLIRAKFFAVIRQIFEQVESELISLNFLEAAGDIQYLSTKEVWDFLNLNSINVSLKELVALRRREYSPNYSPNQSKPNLWGTTNLVDFYSGQIQQKAIPEKANSETNYLQGLACSSGCARGKITILNSFPPKNQKLEIVAVSHLDPGWVSLFDRISGLIIEQGGLLSHGAIIAREMKIPAVISVDISKLENGMEVILDAENGLVEILSSKEKVKIDSETTLKTSIKTE